jgi:hypothetical protein
LNVSGLLAQSTGQISGSVRDATGAFVPGAQVTITNQATGVSHPGETNSAGEFILPALTAGAYEVKAESKGFQPAIQRDVVLQVGGRARVEITLQVAATTTSVEVTGTLTTVETETAALSGVVTGNQILNLSLPARNFVALAMLVPGAAPMNGLNTDSVGVLGNVEVSFNGGRTTYNTWEVDGGNNSDRGSNSTLNTYPSLDAIAEFRVSTANYGADIGQHSGGYIEVSTKSGGRDFHGSAYDFLRNDKLNANNFFTNRQILGPGEKVKRNPHKRNEYGYTVGGPLYIPGVYNTGKDKTFFFWSQAWRKFRDSSVGQAVVATDRQRGGDFSECLEGNANFNQALVDDGCEFPANADPVTGMLPSLDSNGVELMDAFLPRANSGAYHYVSATSTPVNWRQEQLRVDHNFSDRTRLFVRYTQDAWETITPNALWSWSDTDTVKTAFAGPGKSAVLNFAHSFTPSLFSEFIMAYTVDHIDLRVLAGPTSVSGNLARSSSFNGPHIFPSNDGNPYLPGLGICDGTQICLGQGWWFPYGPYNSNPIITWKENMTWIKGKHTVKFGAYVERFRKNESFGGATQGYANFSSNGTTSTGNGMADLLSGVLESYSEGNKYGKGYYRSTNFEPYIQDDWKISRKLTLNLGVRYYLFTRNRERFLQQSGFYPSLFNPADAPLRDDDGFLIPGSGTIFPSSGQFTFGNGLVQCGQGGIQVACQNGEFKNIAPRLGFAWDPWGDGKTSIRAAVGLFYDGLNGNEAGSEATQGGAPFAFSSSLANLDNWAQIGLGGGKVGPAGINTISKTAGFPRTYQWNFNVQRQLTANDLVTVAYVGNAGNHLSLDHQIDLVPLGLPHADQDLLIGGEDTYPYLPFQGFTQVTVKDQIARSNYNSLQASYRHQTSHGLNLGANYTWSHAIDNAGGQGDRRQQDEYNLWRWRGNSSLDRRHMLNLNYVYELPFFKQSKGVAKQTLGGWTVSGIVTFMSGTPLDIGCGISGLSTGVGGGMRCNSVGKQSGKSIVNDSEFGATVQWLNVDAFTQPNLDQLYADNQPGMFGYLGRNTLRGPGRNNWDLSLFKNFPFTERVGLQLRFETFNTWNHTQWRGVRTGCSSSVGAGESCATGSFGQVSSAWTPRIIQLGLRLSF